jgi:hypothetical protein
MTVYGWEVDARNGVDPKLVEAKRKSYSLSREIESLQTLQTIMPHIADQFQEKIDKLQIDLDSWNNYIKMWTQKE